MSINNIQNYSTDSKEIYADYKFGDTFYRDKTATNERPPGLAAILPNASDYNFRTDYFIPLSSVKQQILNSENIFGLIKSILLHNKIHLHSSNPYVHFLITIFTKITRKKLIITLHAEYGQHKLKFKTINETFFILSDSFNFYYLNITKIGISRYRWIN
mgnify:CR=1 FL=1